jgi:hypothetical protein
MMSETGRVNGGQEAPSTELGVSEADFSSFLKD